MLPLIWLQKCKTRNLSKIRVNNSGYEHPFIHFNLPRPVAPDPEQIYV